MSSDLDRKLHGALLGLAVGDAIGAPFEGQVGVLREDVEDWIAAARQLRWTDDTHMALGLARSLIDNDGEVDEQHLGDTLASLHAAEPWRGYGFGPPHVFELARGGLPYVEAAASLFGGSGSFGNGAAMRVAPVAMVAAPDAALASVLAGRQARVTHTHVEAVDGARFVAAAVALLPRVHGQAALVREALEEAVGHLDAGVLREAVLKVVGASAAGVDLIGHARSGGTGVAARESVPAAVAALLTGHDLRSVLIAAVTMGGDTDTIAAMAGAMAGALYGVGGVPEGALERLEAREEIERLVGELADIRRRGAKARTPD